MVKGVNSRSSTRKGSRAAPWRLDTCLAYSIA